MYYEIAVIIKIEYIGMVKSFDYLSSPNNTYRYRERRRRTDKT